MSAKAACLFATILSCSCGVGVSAEEWLDEGKVMSLHKLIKPTEVESRFLQIPWMTSIHAARQKAAVDGKPLMIFMIHGHLLAGC